jgi:histidinol-phosphate aminotransferase
VADKRIEELIRPHLTSIQTYQPVDPPEVLAQRAGVATESIVKLNGNENPYGPSPKAAEAVSTAELHIYPDPFQRKLRSALSEYTGFGSENIIAGAGSDELIDLLFRLFIEPGDVILDCEPTFAMYAFCARVAGGELRLIQRDELFEIDLQAVRDAINDKTKIIFISSPNNPTGNMASDDQVRALLDTGLVVVIDEAYYEFSGETAAGLIEEYDNLVVLRTMSKWAGLAGLRIGYGIMDSALVNHIIDIKSPYNVNVAAEAAALASLEDSDYLLGNVQSIVDDRESMFQALDEIDGIKPWPSQGNYILCQFDGREKAVDMFNQLSARGIFVRNFGSDRLTDCFRVAIGTPDENAAFLDAVREIAQ